MSYNSKAIAQEFNNLKAGGYQRFSAGKQLKKNFVPHLNLEKIRQRERSPDSPPLDQPLSRF